VQRLPDRAGGAHRRRVRDSHDFWNDADKGDLRTIMHWRGEGPFDDDLWLRLGREHLDHFCRAATWAEADLPMDGIVEWGCGGGMNAVQLCTIADKVYGVDLNPDSLDECARQVAQVEGGSFQPILIDAGQPEAVRQAIDGPCSGFFSSYVFELFPTPEYGISVLRLAHEILSPGGVAVVQIRYHSGPKARPGVRHSYASTWLNTSTYTIDGFWTSCEDLGFEPLFVKLVPEMPELEEHSYAWFAMRKPALEGTGTGNGKA
jgi:SAM-dependent methyltransferase